MTGRNWKRWRASIVLTSVIGCSLGFSGQLSAQYLTVFGGPTYLSSTGNGHKFVPYDPSTVSPFTDPDVGNGVGVGYSTKYTAGVNMGRRAIRWDAGGIVELPDLGTDNSGKTNSQAWATNAAGIAVGASTKFDSGVDKGLRPIRWDASGAMTELSYSGFSDSEAVAINSAGLAVGYGDELGGTRAIRWNLSGTASIQLDALNSPNPIRTSFAFAVNDAGTTVGYSSLGNSLGYRAVRWNASGTAVTELGNIGLDSGGGTHAVAYDINNAGTAVGFAVKNIPFQSSQGPRAIRWNASGTAATELDGYGSDTYAFAINSAGTAVGESLGHAVRWDGSGTAVTGLAGIGTTVGRAAYDINDSGLAVGYGKYYDPSDPFFLSPRALMWLPDGSGVDLNSLIDASSGWSLTSASAINNNNWVSGVGTFDPDGAGPLQSYQRMFLLQVPEPTSTAFLTIGAVTLLSRRRQNP